MVVFFVFFYFLVLLNCCFLFILNDETRVARWLKEDMIGWSPSALKSSFLVKFQQICLCIDSPWNAKYTLSIHISSLSACVHQRVVYHIFIADCTLISLSFFINKSPFLTDLCLCFWLHASLDWTPWSIVPKFMQYTWSSHASAAMWLMLHSIEDWSRCVNIEWLTIMESRHCFALE